MEDFLGNVWKTIVEYWFLIAMVITTVVMAMFRTAKKDGKIDYLESIMCAIFTYGVWFVLTWLNLPEGIGVLIGGLIGYSGTHITSNWLYKKIGIDLEDTE